jgi:PAS domain S-box-containing protein
MGYTGEEVMGRNLVQEFISPDYGVQVEEMLDNALKGQQTANFEFPLFTKNQERVEILLNAATRRDGGAATHFLCGVTLTVFVCTCKL